MTSCRCDPRHLEVGGYDPGCPSHDPVGEQSVDSEPSRSRQLAALAQRVLATGVLATGVPTGRRPGSADPVTVPLFHRTCAALGEACHALEELSLRATTLGDALRYERARMLVGQALDGVSGSFVPSRPMFSDSRGGDRPDP